MSTNCVFPPELDDRQLMAYLDDPAASPETANHLEKCSYCREKAESLARFQNQLTSRLYRSTCPSALELGEYHLRMLPDSQKLVVAQHVRECPHCSLELSELGGFLSEFAPRQNVLEPVKVLFARLLPSEGAVRGEAPTARVFQAEDIVVSLETQQTSKGETFIQGLIASPQQSQWTGATVELQQDYLTSLIASVDEMGSFSFAESAPGPTQVTVTSPAGIAVQTEKVNLTR